MGDNYWYGLEFGNGEKVMPDDQHPNWLARFPERAERDRWVEAGAKSGSGFRLAITSNHPAVRYQKQTKRPGFWADIVGFIGQSVRAR